VGAAMMTRFRTLNIAKTLLVATVAIGTTSCFFLKYPRNGIYLLPKGFTGYVLIFYGVPDGVQLETEGGFWVYNIPSDGILKVKDKASPGIVNQEYFYVDDSGERRSIPTLRITGDRAPNGQPQNKFGNISTDQFENTVYVTGQSGFGTLPLDGNVYQYTSFVVATPKQSDSIYNQMENRKSEFVQDHMKLLQKR
jgi:hypothetical protein